MPAPYRKHSPHPATPEHRLIDAAKQGQLIVMRCNLCRRTAHYLASDLIKIYNPEWVADRPLFPCGKCGKEEYLVIWCRLPEPGDYGNLDIRRPSRVVKTQLWRTVKLGD